VDAAVREHFLHRLHKLVHKGIQFPGRGSRPPQSEIERVVEIPLVIGAGVDVTGEDKVAVFGLLMTGKAGFEQRLFITLSGCGRDVGDPAGQRCNGNQRDSDPFHTHTVSLQKAEDARGVRNSLESRHGLLLVKRVLGVHLYQLPTA